MPDAAHQAGPLRPRFEHDACGVAFVVDMHGPRQPRHRRAGPRLRCATSTTGAPPAPRSNTGDGAGILIQMPDRVPPGGRRLRPARRPAPTPPASRSCPRTPRPRPPPRPAIEKIVAERGPQVLGWRDVPDRRLDDRAAGRRRRAVVPPAVRRRPTARRSPASTSSAGLHRAQADRARGRHATTSACTSRASRRRTLVYKGMLTTRQLATFFPDLADERRRERARARALAVLAPTRSRRGRWPTRTATSPTTARSTPCRATATGCGPARRCSTATCSPATRAHLPDLHARRSRLGHASTRCSSCCTSAAARCPTPC